MKLLNHENIELHTPASSTQKLKLIGKGGQFTCTPTLPLTCMSHMWILEWDYNYFN
jgi:hypothetical protein